jgi:subfamily B ATP-binding cassette protein MsbA
MSIVKKILTLTKPYRTRIFFGIVLSLIVSGITGAIAWAVKPAIDEIVVGKKYEYYVIFPVGVFLLFSIKGLFSFGQLYLMKSSGMKCLVREPMKWLRRCTKHHLSAIPTNIP